jgi:hypothetical protein
MGRKSWFRWVEIDRLMKEMAHNIFYAHVETNTDKLRHCPLPPTDIGVISVG